MKPTKRERLARLLTEESGRPFTAENIYPATGGARTGGGDFFRWTATTNGHGWGFDSYDTITDCLRFGVELDEELHYANAKRPAGS